MLVVICAICSAWLGKIWLKRWFNPLTLYSAVWGTCLSLYQLGLIQYYPLSTRAWFCIMAAWGCFILGAGIAYLFFAPRHGIAAPAPGLGRIIVWLTAIGSLAVIDQARTIIREFGTLGAIFVNATDIYGFRISGEDTSLPYAGALLYAGCALAGVHAAKLGKIGVGLFPLSMLVPNGLLAMGRSGIAVGAFLFLACYLSSRRNNIVLSPKRKILYAGVAILLLLSIKFISDLRGAGTVAYPGETDAFERLNEYAPVLAGLTANIAATPVAFSMYLDTPEETKWGLWAGYTFAPIYRLLFRIGFNTHVPAYEESYDTPIPVNISTYLKNVYSDFGLAGVFVFPFLLAFCATALTLRPTTLTAHVILAHLCAVIAFSTLFNIMLLGYWHLSLAVSVLISLAVSHSRSITVSPK